MRSGRLTAAKIERAFSPRSFKPFSPLTARRFLEVLEVLAVLWILVRDWRRDLPKSILRQLVGAVREPQ